ncbi:MAG: hypothetical protein KAI79_07545 [Bacteroidales bacterium]|nr:hypothetical protein [Bacteroidales bacterium]
MHKILFIFLIITSFSFSCYTDSTSTSPENGAANNKIAVLHISENNLCINYYGTINNFPASVKLTIKNGGQRIRTDIKTFDGNKTQQISYIKLQDEIYSLDANTNVVSQKNFDKDDFIHFFYLPSDHFLSKSLLDNNVEIMENAWHLGKICTHFQIKTDTSHAEFHVWNNILLKINTQMHNDGNTYKINLEAVSIEKELIPNDSIFTKPI